MLHCKRIALIFLTVISISPHSQASSCYEELTKLLGGIKDTAGGDDLTKARKLVSIAENLEKLTGCPNLAEAAKARALAGKSFGAIGDSMVTLRVPLGDLETLTLKEQEIYQDMIANYARSGADWALAAKSLSAPTDTAKKQSYEKKAKVMGKLARNFFETLSVYLTDSQRTALGNRIEGDLKIAFSDPLSPSAPKIVTLPVNAKPINDGPDGTGHAKVFIDPVDADFVIKARPQNPYATFTEEIVIPKSFDVLVTKYGYPIGQTVTVKFGESAGATVPGVSMERVKVQTNCSDCIERIIKFNGENIGVPNDAVQAAASLFKQIQTDLKDLGVNPDAFADVQFLVSVNKSGKLVPLVTGKGTTARLIVPIDWQIDVAKLNIP